MFEELKLDDYTRTHVQVTVSPLSIYLQIFVVHLYLEYSNIKFFSTDSMIKNAEISNKPNGSESAFDCGLKGDLGCLLLICLVKKLH